MRSKPLSLPLALVGLTLALVMPGVAFANGGGGHGAKTNAPVERVPSVPSVQMPMLVAPLVIDGQLTRYVYLSVMLILPDDSNKLMLLEKIPYLQDAFLREVHGAPIALNNDPNILDEAGLGDRLLSVCAGIVGAGIVKKVDLHDSSKDFQ